MPDLLVLHSTIYSHEPGQRCFQGPKIDLSHVFGGSSLGVAQVSDRIAPNLHMDYGLSYFDDETCRLEPIRNPFGATVLSVSPE